MFLDAKFWISLLYILTVKFSNPNPVCMFMKTSEEALSGTVAYKLHIYSSLHTFSIAFVLVHYVDRKGPILFPTENP